MRGENFELDVSGVDKNQDLKNMFLYNFSEIHSHIQIVDFYQNIPPSV